MLVVGIDLWCLYRMGVKMSRVCASDWIGLNCGDTVCLHDDPVHEARVEAVSARGKAKIRFHDNGWTMHVDIEEVQVVRRAQQASVTNFVPRRPRTVVESARSKLERELRELRRRG